MLLLKAFFTYYFQDYIKKITIFRTALLDNIEQIKMNKNLKITNNENFLQIEYQDYDIRVYKKYFFINFDSITIDDKHKELSFDEFLYILKMLNITNLYKYFR